MKQMCTFIALTKALSLTLMAGLITGARPVPPVQDGVAKKRLPPGAPDYEPYAARESSEKLDIDVCGRGSGGHPAHVVHFCRGYSQFSEGRYKEAAESFKQAAAGKPDWARAHHGLGLAYETLGQYSEAAAAYKQALSLKPEFPLNLYTLYNLANAYAAVGRYQEAIEAYRQLLSLRPDLPLFGVRYNLGLAYAASRRGKEAVEAFKEAAKALTYYSDSPDLQRKLAPTFYNLGLAHAGLGQDGEAIGAFKEAVRLSPSYAEAQYNLGVTYYLTGNQMAFRGQQEVLRTLKPELAKRLEQLNSMK